MAMYYLSQAGEVSGPHGVGKLIELEEAGEIGSEDAVALVGTEDWQSALEIIYALQLEREEKRKDERARRHRKPKPKPKPLPMQKVRPYWMISLPIGILGIIGSLWFGLAFLISFNALALLLCLLSLAALGFSVLLGRPRYLCGKCGNRVEKTSRLCPTCDSALLPK